jgi:pyruvate/2-oxoglutarate dehydrogenase complex dihydrolipoamide acyltransferase (E2) component
MNSPSPSLRPHRRLISPRARRALSERGLDIASLPGGLQGSGPNGRIVEADVLRVSLQPPPQPQIQAPQTQAPESLAPPAPRGVEVATASITLSAEVDASALLEVHRRLGDHARREGGPSWTPGDFVLCALGRALRAHSEANRAWREGAAVELDSVDIGLLNRSEAQQPLMIRDAGRLSLLEAARQRENSQPDAQREPLGGAMLLLDASTCRADEASPPLLAGFGGALGLGRIAARPFVIDGALEIRPTLRLTLCLDARVWSAGLAARFLGFLVERVEEPELLIFG